MNFCNTVKKNIVRWSCSYASSTDVETNIEEYSHGHFHLQVMQPESTLSI